MLQVASVVLVGIAFLHAFYRVVETQWPDSYYSVGSGLDERISRNPLRYVLFRFVPMVTVAVCSAVTLSRLGQPVVWPTAALGLVHAASTAFRAALGLILHGRARRHPVALCAHLVLGGVLVGIAVSGALIAPLFEAWVPRPSEFVTTLWTAVAAGVAGAFLIRMTSSEPEDKSAAFEQSRRSVGNDLWSYAEDVAIANGAEPRLVHAFMLVENSQRPSWVRAAERFVGRFAGGATYGPLQHHAGRPLSDRDALEGSIKMHFAGRTVPRTRTEYGSEHFNEGWIRLFAQAYNPSNTYADDVVAAYSWLHRDRESNALVQTESRAADGLPEIEIRGVEVRDGRLRIRGTVCVFEGNVVVRQLNAGGLECGRSYAQASRGAPERGEVDFEVQPLPRALTVELSTSDGGEEGEGWPLETTNRVEIPIPARLVRAIAAGPDQAPPAKQM